MSKYREKAEKRRDARRKAHDDQKGGNNSGEHRPGSMKCRPN